MTNDARNIDLDQLFNTTASSLETLYKRANSDDGGRARILFFALAAFLDQEGIVDALKAAAQYMAAHDPQNLPAPSKMIQ